MPTADLLIHPRWIITVDPENRRLENHSIAVQDGRIVALLSDEKVKAWEARQNISLPDHAITPGFINAHTHAAMSLLRGIADDIPLMEWLQNHIWPVEKKFVNEQFIHDGSQLAIAEMLRSGTTCFNDMYLFPDVTARVAATAGMRACIGLIVIDFPTAYAENPEDYLSKGLALYDEYKAHPLISFAFAPHAPYTVSDAPLKRIRMLADELDLPIHMHLHETQDEIEQSIQSHQKRPIERLHELGLLSPGLMAVHMTQLSETDIELATQANLQIIHCPESNLKLASGFCPVQKLIDSGIRVALGTDSAASNNDLDMLGEMKTAALLAKAVHNDAKALPAMEALRMATINGAQALGIADQTGSIETGKWADLCAIDLGTIESLPVNDQVSQIVYCAGREQVTDVWVAGNQLLKDRKLTTLDEYTIKEAAVAWQREYSAR